MVARKQGGGINIPRLRIVLDVRAARGARGGEGTRGLRIRFACEFSASHTPHECPSSFVQGGELIFREDTGGEFE